MEEQFEVAAVRFGVFVICFYLIAPGTAPAFADDLSNDCDGWRAIRVGGGVQHMAGERRGEPVSTGECLVAGHAVRTLDMGEIVLQRDDETLAIAANTMAVLDSPPMIFRGEWLKASLNSSHKMVARKEKFSAQTPAAVAGVRGASRSDANRAGDVQWFGAEDDDAGQSRDLEKTYQKLKKIRNDSKDTEVRNRMDLYLADVAILLLRPDEARAFLLAIPTTSRSYPEARKRLGK